MVDENQQVVTKQTTEKKVPLQLVRYEIGENLSMVLFVAIVMLGITLCAIFGKIPLH